MWLSTESRSEFSEPAEEASSAELSMLIFGLPLLPLLEAGRASRPSEDWRLPRAAATFLAAFFARFRAMVSSSRMGSAMARSYFWSSG